MWLHILRIDIAHWGMLVIQSPQWPALHMDGGKLLLRLAPLPRTMSWKKSRITSSLLSLFSEPAPSAVSDERVQDIRQAMLNCLATLTASEQTLHTTARVRRAPDIQALWYLRADMMTLLATLVGEVQARLQLLPITNMFVGLLPAAQKARPSRLHF